MKITRTSIYSGKRRTLDLNVTQQQVDRLKTEHIQDVLPHLSDDDREFILTGVTKYEWDKMFEEE